MKKMQIKRKLYTRRSSFETTIPAPLLFSIDKKRKHNVIFEYDPTTGRWFIRIQEQKEAGEKKE
jgi:hypothetical protein